MYITRLVKAIAASALILAAFFVAISSQAAPTSGVVGDGTPASCTQSAFVSAITGGGTVTFDCGDDPHTIEMTYYKSIFVDTHIDGGGMITLSGGNATGLFRVGGSATLTLENIFLTGANSSFGTIRNFGVLDFIDSTLTFGYGDSSTGGIENYGVVTITNSTLSYNESGGSAGAILNDYGKVTVQDSRFYYNTAVNYGGAIANSYGTLDIDNSDFQHNGDHPCSFQSGGAIYNTGTMTVTNSEFSYNQALRGGGIYNGTNATLYAANNQFTQNSSNCTNVGYGGGLHNLGNYAAQGNVFISNNGGSYGGGVYNGQDAFAIAQSEVYSDNHSSAGGGIANHGTLDLKSTTVFSNTSNFGAGIEVEYTGTLTISNVTIDGNVASGSGAGIFLGSGSIDARFVTITDNEGTSGVRIYPAYSADVIFMNSIIAGNQTANCDGALTSYGYNLASDLTCNFYHAGDLLNIDPGLMPLGDYGGPTLTREPESNSPVVDAGHCSSGVTTDQRGILRPQGDACDIGAVELEEIFNIFVPLLMK